MSTVKLTINTGDLRVGDEEVGFARRRVASVTVTPSDMPAYQKQAIESSGGRVGSKVEIVYEDGERHETSTHFETTVIRAVRTYSVQVEKHGEVLAELANHVEADTALDSADAYNAAPGYGDGTCAVVIDDADGQPACMAVLGTAGGAGGCECHRCQGGMTVKEEADAMGETELTAESTSKETGL